MFDEEEHDSLSESEEHWQDYQHYINSGNDHAAAISLIRAAQKGHSEAMKLLKQNTSNSLYAGVLHQMQSDKDVQNDAEHIFNEKLGLANAIRDNIFPAVVSVKTANGIVGMGFFQHSAWLVSNAHVLPCRELLEGSTLSAFESPSTQLGAKKSYHRPADNDSAPDLVIANLLPAQPAHGISKSIPVNFNDDECHHESHLFYVSIDVNSHQYQIRYLRLLSSSTYPFIYECINGEEPQEGSSGTPIIEARITSGREPQWQFRVVSVLYARCTHTWYRQQTTNSINLSSEGAKLVCAIPVRQDFCQILHDIIYPNSMANRHQRMAAASRQLGDVKGMADAEQFSSEAEEYQKLARAGLKRFELGTSNLNITLPEGLEKLYYKGIVSIECSLLIPKVRKKQLKKQAESFNIPSCEVSDLQKEFIDLLEGIKKTPMINLKQGDGIILSTNELFRIDISGSNKKGWKIDIQDNTGKGRCNGLPLSSVFAIVKTSRNIECMPGSALAKLFSDSQAQKRAANYKPQNSPPQSLTFQPKKKGKIKSKKKMVNSLSQVNSTQIAKTEGVKPPT